MCRIFFYLFHINRNLKREILRMCLTSYFVINFKIFTSRRRITKINVLFILIHQVMCYLKNNGQNFYRITNIFQRNYYMPLPEDANAVDMLFVIHTLNFSLWRPRDINHNQWKFNRTTGYHAIGCVVKRAINASR